MHIILAIACILSSDLMAPTMASVTTTPGPLRPLRNSRRSLSLRCRGAASVAVDSAVERAAILSEALPYLQRFSGQTLVIKYGGAAIASDESTAANDSSGRSAREAVLADIALLSLVGIRVVLVHGGGPEINRWLKTTGAPPAEFDKETGLRVTSSEVMEVVEMALSGRVNKALAAGVTAAGAHAVGISGRDAKMLIAKQISPALGRVGSVTEVNATVLEALASAGMIPVVATVAADESDLSLSLNVNADSAAAAIAQALGAEKLILMTDVPGIMRDPKDQSTLVSRASVVQVNGLIEEGIISGGMIPKVQCCLDVVSNGVSSAHIIDGRQAHSLLMEIVTDAGKGSMITLH